MDISIIIVNYNTLELTKRSIDSVFRHNNDLKIEIIVVDNASADGSRKHFENDNRITYIYSEENLGFGRANNIGIEKSDAKYVFLLNSDAYLIEDVLTPFFEFMENPQNSSVACCGANVIDSQGNEEYVGGNLPTFLESISKLGFGILYYEYYKQKLCIGLKNSEIKSLNKKYEIGYVIGADMFIRKSILDQVGLFDSDFFLYFEETELSFRFKKFGYKSMILSEINLVHDHGGSSEKKGINLKMEKIFAQSRFLYFKKCYSKIIAVIITILFSFKSFLKGMLSLNKDKISESKVIFKAISTSYYFRK